MQKFVAENKQQMPEIARQIAVSINAPHCIYLYGSLGAGKTTLAKGIINTLGYEGAVTSPTYNLIQEYSVEGATLYHMDLYRLEDESELEYLALADLWNEHSIFIIEWPENGQGYLPACDLKIELSKLDKGRQIHIQNTSK